MLVHIPLDVAKNGLPIILRNILGLIYVVLIGRSGILLLVDISGLFLFDQNVLATQQRNLLLGLMLLFLSGEHLQSGSLFHFDLTLS